MTLIIFKILVTIILSSLVIMPVSCLFVIDKMIKYFNDEKIETDLREKIFNNIFGLTFTLFSLSCLLIFPIGIILIVQKLWS